MTAVFLSKCKNNSKMKTNQLAPIGADLIGDFLKKLPKKAPVLGFKGRHSAGKLEFSIAYLFKGQIVHQTFSMEGGTL